MSRLKRVLVKTAKVLFVLGLFLVLVDGILTVVWGRRFEHEVRKIAARGDPIRLTDFGRDTVPDDENAALVFSSIFTRLEQPRLDKDQHVLTEVLEAADPKGPALAAWAAAARAAPSFDWLPGDVSEALSRPYCKFPVDWAKGYEAQLPHYARLRKISHILHARALLYARKGKTDEAVRHVKLIDGISDALREDPMLIGLLVRVAIARSAASAARDILRYDKLISIQAVELSAAFEHPDFPLRLAKSLKSERAFMLGIFEQARSNGPLWVAHVLAGGESKECKRSRVLGLMSSPWVYADGTICLRAMDRMAAKLAKPYRELGPLGLDETRGIPRYALLTRALLPAFGNLRGLVDSAQAELAQTQIALALAAHKDAHGAYPAALSELKTSLPEDPFSGKPFRYSRRFSGYTLYSVGANLKDDGGRDRLTADEKYRLRKPEPDDVVFNMDR